MSRVWNITARSCSRSSRRASKLIITPSAKDQVTDHGALQRSTNLHLPLRQHHEPLYSKAERLSQQTGRQVSNTTLMFAFTYIQDTNCLTEPSLDRSSRRLRRRISAPELVAASLERSPPTPKKAALEDNNGDIHKRGRRVASETHIEWRTRSFQRQFPFFRFTLISLRAHKHRILLHTAT
jgi:hypothetical protein